jgi:hypothetical protein
VYITVVFALSKKGDAALVFTYQFTHPMEDQGFSTLKSETCSRALKTPKHRRPANWKLMFLRFLNDLRKPGSSKYCLVLFLQALIGAIFSRTLNEQRRHSHDIYSAQSLDLMNLELCSRPRSSARACQGRDFNRYVLPIRLCFDLE